MKKGLVILATVSCLLIAARTAHAQASTDSSLYLIVKTHDDNSYRGQLLSKDSSHIRLLTEQVGEVRIARNQIKRVSQINAAALNNEGYWFENPNATRQFYSPTGYGLRKGEGYYQNFMLFLNSVSYGFTDNITVGLGVSPLSFNESLIFSIMPKLSFPVMEDKVNVGLGGLYLHLGDGENLGIVYGVGTFGSRDRNVTIGAGWGIVDNDWANRPVITISGMYRLSQRWGFITENWLIPTEGYSSDGNSINYHPIFSYGLRVINERITIDFGFIVEEDIVDVFKIGFPIVGIVLPFGKPYRSNIDL